MLKSRIALLFVNLAFINLPTPSIRVWVLLLMLPISFLIMMYIGVIIGSINFFLKDKREMESIHTAYGALLPILIGSIIPLTFSDNIKWLQFSPFAWVQHHPMQIYLGEYSSLQILYTLLGGIAWCFLLYVLANLIFKLGLKRNESVGL